MRACSIFLAALTISCLFATVNTVHANEGNELLPEGKIAESEIRLMTWNVKFLPRILKSSICQYPEKRADLLPKYIINDSIDIIVFQEAFDKKAINIMDRHLSKHFPYKAGPGNNKPSFKLTSGVLMYSRYPIKKLEDIRYRECEGEDCFARKGVLLCEVDINGQAIQVAGTHMEAGGTRMHKIGQYQEMSNLMKNHERQGVPQFLCGDFNTKIADTILYPILIETLDAENGPLHSELKFTSDKLKNDMNWGKKGSKPRNQRHLIDFIFYRPNGFEMKAMKRYVIQYEERWHPKYKDLSDHNAVLMRMLL